MKLDICYLAKDHKLLKEGDQHPSQTMYFSISNYKYNVDSDYCLCMSYHNITTYMSRYISPYHYIVAAINDGYFILFQYLRRHFNPGTNICLSLSTVVLNSRD